MQDLFFYLSKIFWAFASPDHFLLLLILVGLLLIWAGRRCGLWLSLFAVSLLIAIGLYPVGNFLLSPLENRFAQVELPEHVAGVIVLGGAEEATLSAIRRQPHMNSAAERVMVIPVLMQRYPGVPFVITGGSSSINDQTYRGADVVEQWLQSLGLAERLIVERESRNTFENAIYTADHIDPEAGQWLLVTSAFHMPRAVAVFRKQGWDVLPYAVDYRVSSDRPAIQFWRNMRDFSIAVREWVGIVTYYLTDKTDQLLPDR